MRKPTFRNQAKNKLTVDNLSKEKKADDRGTAKLWKMFDKLEGRYFSWPDQKRERWEQEALQVNRKRKFMNPPLKPISGFTLYLCSRLDQIHTGQACFIKNYMMK